MNSSLPGQDPQREQLQGVGEIMELLLTGISDRIKILEFTDTLIRVYFPHKISGQNQLMAVGTSTGKSTPRSPLGNIYSPKKMSL